MSDLPAYRRAARTAPCWFCGAEVGEPCRAPSGRATYEHCARYRLVRPAQNIGYEEGLADAITILDWQVDKHGTNTTAEQVRRQIARQLGAVRRSNLREEAL